MESNSNQGYKYEISERVGWVRQGILIKLEGILNLGLYSLGFGNLYPIWYINGLVNSMKVLGCSRFETDSELRSILEQGKTEMVLRTLNQRDRGFS